MGGGRRRWVREPALRRRRVPLARLFELANAVSLERPARLTLGDRDVRVRAVGTRARGGSVGAPSAKLFAQEPLAIGGSRRGLRLPGRRPDRGEAADGRIGIRVVPSEHRPGLGHRRVRFYDVWRRLCRAFILLGSRRSYDFCHRHLFDSDKPRAPPSQPDVGRHAASSRQLCGRGRGSPGPRPGEPRARRVTFRRRSHGGASPTSPPPTKKTPKSARLRDNPAPPRARR